MHKRLKSAPEAQGISEARAVQASTTSYKATLPGGFLIHETKTVRANGLFRLGALTAASGGMKGAINYL